MVDVNRLSKVYGGHVAVEDVPTAPGRLRDGYGPSKSNCKYQPPGESSRVAADRHRTPQDGRHQGGIALLVGDASLTAQSWAKVAASVGLWVLLPLGVGLTRLL
jgi:hypothetical protein